MRKLAAAIMMTGAILLAACNTVQGVGRDAKSVGRVFTDHPDGPPKSR